MLSCINLQYINKMQFEYIESTSDMFIAYYLHIKILAKLHLMLESFSLPLFSGFFSSPIYVTVHPATSLPLSERPRPLCSTFSHLEYRHSTRQAQSSMNINNYLFNINNNYLNALFT